MIPSHLPTTYSARASGRARRASEIPDSTSDESAGAEMNAAESVTARLNMNITRMSSCDEIAVCWIGGSGTPPFRRSAIREKPHTVRAMTTSVSATRAKSSFRRDASRSTSRAMTTVGVTGRAA